MHKYAVFTLAQRLFPIPILQLVHTRLPKVFITNLLSTVCELCLAIPQACVTLESFVSVYKRGGRSPLILMYALLLP